MLTLIGLGLYDEKDLTLRGIEAAKSADKVYIELYTSKWHGSVQELESVIGKKIEVLTRKDLEENSAKILEEAKSKEIVIFVQGDPLIATVHTTLVMDSKKDNIKVNIVHNASIISAITECGLHPYKFGAMVTIPFPEKTKGRLPESVYEIIKMNKSRGLHTLCLLDVVGEEKRYLMPEEAMKVLLEIEEKRKEDVFTEDTEVVVFARVGSEKPLIVYNKVGEMINRNLKELPAVLIIPGILHFTEKEYLSLLCSEI